MPENFIQQIKTGFILLLILTLLTGFVYPFSVTVIAQLFFPWKANGSLIKKNGEIVGSELIGQSFTSDKYFWGRPSATPLFPYNAENSSGSNLSLSNPEFLMIVKERIQKLDAKNNMLIPVDLVTASGSGLDPDISPAAAFYQVSRIAKARHIAPEIIESKIQQAIKKCSLGVFGAARVNVLQLNLALDDVRE